MCAPVTTRADLGGGRLDVDVGQMTGQLCTHFKSTSTEIAATTALEHVE